MNDRDFLEQLREATDLPALIGERVELRRAGRQLRGRSPFHEDRTPSFFVDPGKQVWYDHAGGEGRGGDCFDWLMAIEGCDFPEARRRLAARAGLRLPERSAEEHARLTEERQRRAQLHALLTKAARYYQSRLPDALRARLLREHYGFSDATIALFGLGFSDGGLWRHLTVEEAIPEALALATGLFVRLKDGRVVELFERRLVFPYWRRGKVMGMAARRTQHTPDKPWEQAKYKRLLGTSERHPYVSKLLGDPPFFNEDAAAGAKELLIAEGLADCISSAQAGFACISPGTTVFREADHQRLTALAKRCERVFIANDAEESGAGWRGAMATAKLLHGAGVDVRLVRIPRPEGVRKRDLNELLRGSRPEALRALMDDSARYLVACIDEIPADLDKAELGARLEPVLGEVARLDPLGQEHYLEHLRARFGIGLRLSRRLLAGAAVTQPQVEEERVKGCVFVEGSRYYIFTEQGERLFISSFRLEALERVRTEEGECLSVRAMTERGVVVGPILLGPDAWASRRAFIAALGSVDLQWSGSDDNVQGVLRRLSAARVPCREGRAVLGLLDTPEGPRWLTPDEVLGPEGVIEDSAWVYVADRGPLSDRLSLPQVPRTQLEALAQEALPTLLELNTPEVMLPLLGWFFATAVKPRVQAALGHFPVACVWGTQGSGKSTLLTQVLLPLFGYTRTEPFSATDTYFATVKLLSSTTSVPVVIDEYKPSDMPRARLDGLHRLLRRVYGGEVEQRGRPDQSLARYVLSAPVCLAGEACPEDPALLDRFVAVSPNRNTLSADPRHREALAKLRGLPLGALARPYLRFAMGRVSAVDIATARVHTEALLARLPEGERASGRCRDNLVVVVLGVSLLEFFAASLGVELPELDLAPALAAVIDTVMDGDGGGKSPLDHFVEDCATLAHLGELVEDVHYAIVEDLETRRVLTCLHLRACLQVHREVQRRAGLSDLSNGLRALRRLAQENLQRGGYVRDLERRVRLQSGRPRMVALDLEIAGEVLEIESFPRSAVRSWGGARGA